MTYQEIVNEILKIGEKDKKEDFWKEKAEAPLFSRRPYNDYDNVKDITYEEIIKLKIDTRGAQERNPFNALVCAKSGVGKTRLIKNMVKAFHKQGYRILYIEPKSEEMMNAVKMGKGRRLAPKDFNERLPVVTYSPNYIKAFLERVKPNMVHNVKFYSPDISKLDYPEIWQSFGVPIKAAAMLVDLIQKGHHDLDYLENFLSKVNMHSITKQAVSTAIASLKALRYFGARNTLDLEKEWNAGNIVSINYFSRSGGMMNTDIGLLLDLIRDIGIRESSKGLDKVTKKLIIFDDAFFYAGMNAIMGARNNDGINLAIMNIANCQNNFRTWGVDTIFTVQSPSRNAIVPALIDGCTSTFVAWAENPYELRGKIPDEAFSLITNTNPYLPRLYSHEESYTYEWIYTLGRTRWFRGFPFDCTLGTA